MDQGSLPPAVTADLQSPHTAATESSSREQDRGNDYIDLIRECYRRFPESFHYYEQLVEYIGSRGVSRAVSSLQAPKVFGLIPGGDRRWDQYPCFPFQLCSPDHTTDQQPMVKVTVLEGFPSPDCVATLGSRLSLRPELFLGHLDMDRKQSPDKLKKYFELPAPLSFQDNVVHIRLVRLVKSLADSRAPKIKSGLRISEQKACRQNEMDLFSERKYGVVRFRELHIHNSNFFSLEQMVSFSVCPRDDGRWECVCLSDNGRDYMGYSRSPWFHCNRLTGRPLGSIPTLAYNHPFNPNLANRNDVADDLISDLDQLHPLKSMVITTKLDAELLAADPFFILSKLLSVAALTWSQVINFLADDISHHKSGDENDLNHGLEQLRFNAGLLERIEGFLSDNLNLICQGGSASWPKPAATATEVLAHKASLQKALELDTRQLMERCARLAKSCELLTGFLVSSMQLIESQKGINQSQQVHGLTQLAFLFLPPGLLAAVFGMNVAELQSPPSIWVFFAVAASVFVVTLLFLSRHAWMRQVKQLVETKPKQ